MKSLSRNLSFGRNGTKTKLSKVEDGDSSPDSTFKRTEPGSNRSNAPSSTRRRFSFTKKTNSSVRKAVKSTARLDGDVLMTSGPPYSGAPAAEMMDVEPVVDNVVSDRGEMVGRDVIILSNQDFGGLHGQAGEAILYDFEERLYTVLIHRNGKRVQAKAEELVVMRD